MSGNDSSRSETEEFTTSRGKELSTVLGEEHSPSVQTVRKWMRDFKGGRTDCSDLQRSGRPASISTEEKISKVQALVQEDRRITVDQVASELEISHARCLRNNFLTLKNVHKSGLHFLVQFDVLIQNM